MKKVSKEKIEKKSWKKSQKNLETVVNKSI